MPRPFLAQWRDAVAAAPLSSTQKAVAWRAADYAGPDGRDVYPGSVRLALDCGLAVREGARQNSVVDRAFARLVELGLVEKVAKGHRGQAAEYHLKLP